MMGRFLWWFFTGPENKIGGENQRYYFHGPSACSFVRNSVAWMLFFITTTHAGTPLYLLRIHDWIGVVLVGTLYGALLLFVLTLVRSNTRAYKIGGDT